LISFIRGRVEKVGQDFLDVDVRGVGYRVFTSVSTLQKVRKDEEDINLFTFLLVRGDALTLFGFLTEEELNIFEKLISVSGVGPKAALGALSTMNPSTLSNAVIEGNTEELRRIPGIGQKTAQRIILELKDKLDKIAEDINGSNISENKKEAVEALVALGFNAFQVEKVFRDISDTEGDTAQLIRIGLKRLKS